MREIEKTNYVIEKLEELLTLKGNQILKIYT